MVWGSTSGLTSTGGVPRPSSSSDSSLSDCHRDLPNLPKTLNRMVSVRGGLYDGDAVSLSAASCSAETSSWFIS